MQKTIFITGASSGIGAALTREFAARGYDCAISARRFANLAALQQQIQSDWPQRRVHAAALDVTDYDSVFSELRAARAALGSLSIVVANAGLGSVGTVGSGRFHQDRAIIETNVLGAMATADAAISTFREQGAGRLVMISSVAAFRGLPGSGAYSASKAAVATYADAIRAEVSGSPIKVTTLYPGFIDTPINDQMKSRPFLIDVVKGARSMADLIERGVQSATVPAFPWGLVARVLPLLPVRALARTARAGNR
jgi:short-subunit dehydrogenase